MSSPDSIAKQNGHFIDGLFTQGVSQEHFPSVNPATGETLAMLPVGTAHDVDLAVAAAKRAFDQGEWPRLTVANRCRILRRLGDLIEENLVDLARLESLDTGKPITETKTGDVPRAVRNFRFYAEFAQHDPQHAWTGEDGVQHTTIREPLGVVGLITPWNLPLYLETWKLAPALAAGNTVVLKPAELTPLSANALAELSLQAGIPPGVFNVVHGFGAGGAGEALVKHPDVRAISFTGETSTGKAIMATAAATLKKVSFELGGKGASIICADADLDKAVPIACNAAFRNQGQVCLAGSRILVHRSVRDQVVARLQTLVSVMRVGDPLSSETTMGSLISTEHRAKVESYVQHALKVERLNVLIGGHTTGPELGAFFEPTVIVDVPRDSKLAREEIFGPVVIVQTFDSLEEAADIVNGTQYGLSCSIFTKSLANSQFLTKACRMGLVWVNTWGSRDLHVAFGGMKQSGFGREGGRYSLDFFSELKTVSVAGGI